MTFRMCENRGDSSALGAEGLMVVVVAVGS